MEQRATSVMDFAIQAEIDGEAFYSAAASKTDNKGMKAYLSDLAKEEKKHAETFQKLKDKVQKKGVGEVFVNPQVDDYLDAVLRSGLFEMARQAVPNPEGPKTIDDVYRKSCTSGRTRTDYSQWNGSGVCAKVAPGPETSAAVCKCQYCLDPP